tara:strand:+ start:1726 stop:2694 length:969 start_codon:yes stop_codon:yes gene_type:complete
MKIKNRTIQLFLISLGLLLILSTYFLYPRIAGENKTSNLVQDKKTLNKLEKELTDKELKKIEEELANLMNIQRPKIQEELAKANSLNKIEEELDKLKNIQVPIIEEELAKAKSIENFKENKKYKDIKNEKLKIEKKITELNNLIIQENKKYKDNKNEKLKIEKRIAELNNLISENKDLEANLFENVEYKGFYNIDNLFNITSKKARIFNKEPNIVYMTNVKVILYLKDGKIVTITSDEGIYNKDNYDIFFEKNIKATDGKTIIVSENLELFSSKDYAAVYNNVILTNDKSSLRADKVEYDFETQFYQVSMFSNEQIKVKLVE